MLASVQLLLWVAPWAVEGVPYVRSVWLANKNVQIAGREGRLSHQRRQQISNSNSVTKGATEKFVHKSIPYRQVLGPRIGRELVDNACLHSSNLSFENVKREQLFPGFLHMPTKQLFRC